MRFAELFAGAGGLSLGLERAGWDCAWHAEIADAPRAILSHRWPDVPLYGDVTALNGAELVAKHGAISLLSGGSPCQDLSVAGKRAGLEGSRSSLFYQQMRLWAETGADLCLWENVDGARSSLQRTTPPKRTTGLKRGGKIKRNAKREAKRRVRTHGPKGFGAFTREQPCKACGRLFASDPAHVLGNGGMGRKKDWTTIAPLCGPHWMPDPQNPAVQITTVGCHWTFDKMRWRFNELFPDFDPHRAVQEHQQAWSAAQRGEGRD